MREIEFMDDVLLKKFLKYASSKEAFAVLFVKKHLVQSKGNWIDIVDSERYEMSEDNLHFRFVTGGLYKKLIQPKYPPKAEFTLNGVFDERRYSLMVRAITWETAHKDINQQKAKKVRVKKFDISGVSYDKNRGNKNFFIDDTPPEIKALENNLSDRTNPLWDRAMSYINEPEFVYKIKRVSLI